jgi:hypothetical protein
VKGAGVRDVRFHDLRHTFGTRMGAVGVPMRTLQEWLRHADFKTTLIYADYSPDERRDRDLVARAFEGQGSKLGSNLSETESNSDAPNRALPRRRKCERHASLGLWSRWSPVESGRSPSSKSPAKVGPRASGTGVVVWRTKQAPIPPRRLLTPEPAGDWAYP